MKTTHGWALPDGDTHFSEHLAKEFEQNGAAGYQTKKWLAALEVLRGRSLVGGRSHNGSQLANALDIGAHVGLWTVPMAGVFAQVTAFEPMPELAACWIENTAGLANTRLYQVALGGVNGEIKMVAVAANSGNAHVSPKDTGVIPAKAGISVSNGQDNKDSRFHGNDGREMGGISSGRTSREEARVAPEEISVPLRRLDDYELGPVDFIKIDVEGYELSVVRGGEQTIKANRPVMVVEQKPGNGARFGVSDTAAVDLLRWWGAEVAWVKAGDYCMTWSE